MIRLRIVLASVVVLGLVAGTASSQQGQSDFAKGNSHLAQGDLTNALKSYAAAVQADRSNQQYAQQFLLVRRVLLLEKALQQEQDPERWALTAQALRSFYVSRELYQQALPVDQAIFSKDPSANSAIQLAETQLALEDCDAAVNTLQRVPEDAATTGSRALLSVALARQGKQLAAKAAADKVSIGRDLGPGTLYLIARMYAATEDSERSMGVLKQCFESVPPSRLDDLKLHAKECLDFASVAATPEFVSTLQTESKIAESSCSGGSSCATCPMRGNCSGGN